MYHDYKGCIHIHSRESDGSGSVPLIIEKALESGLDYIILTDHNILNRKWEGVYDGLLVLVGEEIGFKDNHFLALKIRQPINPYMQPTEYFDAVRKQNGLGFIAHPHGVRKIMFLLRSRGWTHWSKDGYTGFELWTYMYDWIEKVNPLNLLYYLLKPENAITGPRNKTIKLWDTLNQTRKYVAIGGLDAHATVWSPYLMLNLPSYEKLFRTIRTHIISTEPFTGDLENDARIVYNALGNGHCYISYDYYTDATGVQFYADQHDKILVMGTETTFTQATTLHVRSPRQASIRVVKDGRIIHAELTDTVTLTLSSPGVYRAELFLDSTPWVFTNPVFIRENNS